MAESILFGGCTHGLSVKMKICPKPGVEGLVVLFTIKDIAVVAT